MIVVFRLRNLALSALKLIMKRTKPWHNGLYRILHEKTQPETQKWWIETHRWAQGAPKTDEWYDFAWENSTRIWKRENITGHRRRIIGAEGASEKWYIWRKWRKVYPPPGWGGPQVEKQIWVPDPGNSQILAVWIPDLIEDQHGDKLSRDWVSDKMFEDVDLYTAIIISHAIRVRVVWCK